MTRVLLATYGSRPEAEVVVALLRSEGIEAIVLTDSAGGFEPQLDMIRGVRVLVAEEDLSAAREIVEGIDEDAPPPRAGVTPARGPSPILWFVTIAVAVVVVGVAILVAGGT